MDKRQIEELAEICAKRTAEAINRALVLRDQRIGQLEKKIGKLQKRIAGMEACR